MRDLISVVAEKTGISKKKVKLVVDTTFEEIKREIRKNGRVTVRGFGRFYVVRLKSRRYKHPETGEMKVSPSRKTVRFHPSRKLVLSINT